MRVAAVVLAILVLCSLGSSITAAPADPETLRALYPGLLEYRSPGTLAYYGKPMTAGETPGAAVQTWLDLFSPALGVGAPDLELVRMNTVGHGGRTVLVYQQRLAGLPVEHSRLHFLTLDRDVSHVTLVSARLVPSDSFLSPESVTSTEATDLARLDPEAPGLDRWQEPIAVVWATEELERPTRAWKITASTSQLEGYRAYSFFIDAGTGQLLERRNEVYDVDIAGEITGFATPGTLPDTGANPPLSTPLIGAHVTDTTEHAYAGPDGTYVLPHDGTDPLEIFIDFEGRWTNVIDVAGPDLEDSAVVLPPGPADFSFNFPPSEFTTAQVNALIHTTGVHDYYKERQPDFTDLDISLVTNVNLNDNCNAFFSGADININFFTAGGGCVNTAYSSVIYHEYGHFIVNRLGLAQGAFGEGFSDCVYILAFDTPVVGEDFEGPGTFIRHVVQANLQFPCPCPGGQVHCCGQLLGGCWWDIKEGLVSLLGGDGLETAQQLFTDWSQVTVGGQGSASAHPLTAIEVLMLDDDNGDLGDGTPHRDVICDAFTAHSIDCPGLATIGFDFPQGQPGTLIPDTATTFEVEVIPVLGEPVPGSALLSLGVDGAPLEPAALTALGPNLYEVTLPALPCGSYVEYTLEALDTAGGVRFSPADAPASRHRAVASTGGAFEMLVDDLEIDAGWSVGDPADDAISGIWVREEPVGSLAQPGEDHTPDPGTICWVTGNASDTDPPGTNDVDGGRTTLRSPVYDLSTGGGHEVRFWLWYSNDTGPNPGDDVFTVDVSNQGGAAGSWVNALTVGPGGGQASGGWLEYSIRIADHVAPTSQVQLRFVADDESPGSHVEAAIDDLRITAFECDPTAGEIRRGDCNADGSFNAADPVFLLTAIFVGGVTIVCEDSCDGDDGGSLGLADAVNILNALFLSAPLPPPYPDCGIDPTDDPLVCPVSCL